MPSPPLANRTTALTQGATKAPVVPVPLRAAMEFIAARDYQSDAQTLHSKTVALLSAAKDLVNDPQREFTKRLIKDCFEVIFPRSTEHQSIGDSGLKALSYLPQHITSGFRREHIQFYQSPFGPCAWDTGGVQAFQRDCLKHFSETLSSLKQVSQVPESLAESMGHLSEFILSFRGQATVLGSQSKKIAALDLAQFLLHSDHIDHLTLKAALSILEARETGIASLEAAVNPLLDRARALGINISRDMERELREWAKLKSPLFLSALPQDDRSELVRNLRLSATKFLRSGDGERLELEWMTKVLEAPHNYQYKDASVTHNQFSSARRLTTHEVNEIKLASEFLEREGLIGQAVEMAQSPYVWPRVAELIVVAKPVKVTLHSPTALEPFENPANEGSPALMGQREIQVIPVTMATSPRKIIEREFSLGSKSAVAWDSGLAGECLVDGKKVVVRIDDDLTLTGITRNALPHINPFANCFIIRRHGASSSEPPLAFGVFFPDRLKDIPEHSSHAFGKTVQLYVARDRKPTPIEAASVQSLPTPDSSRRVENSAPEPSVQASIPAPEPLIPPPSPKPEVVVPKKVKKEPPPPTPREPRPKISEAHALSAKVVIASLPEIQGAARASTSLKPVVPFTQPEVITTLNILKNGEKPGNKALKALRAYVAEDANFKDAIRSKTISAVRANLKSLLEELLA